MCAEVTMDARCSSSTMRRDARAARRDPPEQRFEVAGEAASGADALAQYRALRPDAVMLDVALPDMDGATAVRALLAHDPGTRVIACGFSSQRALVDAARAAGAFGYMAKPFAPLLVGAALERARIP